MFSHYFKNEKTQSGREACRVVKIVIKKFLFTYWREKKLLMEKCTRKTKLKKQQIWSLKTRLAPIAFFQLSIFSSQI